MEIQVVKESPERTIVREDNSLRDGNNDKTQEPKKSRTDGGDEQLMGSSNVMQQHGTDSDPQLQQQLQQIRAAQDNILDQVNRQQPDRNLEVQIPNDVHQHGNYHLFPEPSCVGQGGCLMLQHGVKISDIPGTSKEARPQVFEEPVIQEILKLNCVGRLGFGSLSLTAYEQQQKEKYLENKKQNEGAKEYSSSDDVSFVNLLHKKDVAADVSVQSVTREVDEFESQPDNHKSFSDGEEVQDSQLEDAEKVDYEGDDDDVYEDMQSTPFAETIEKIQSGDYLYNKNVKELEAASNKAETEIQGAEEKDVLKARRCSRLASQDGQKIEERAMERAKVKNLCADAGNLIPSYLDVKILI
jgi:hypothetical protein